MPSNARFRFFGRLADLAPAAAGAAYMYSFNGTPALKDAIEAMGVPHVEVGVIIVNRQDSNPAALLRDGDEVAVHPDDSSFPEARFVLDVHLGGLARALRLLGFDTLYRNDYTDPQLAALSDTEDRALLTRDVGLLKHRRIRRGYWLRSQHTEEQAGEVLRRFGLAGAIQPFRRCLACNGPIAPVAEEQVRKLIPPRVLGFQKEFYQCGNCNRVYWKGTHYTRMLDFIERLRK
ncbi:hypothetical protein EPD60_08850 [Flaviaesturariibacter flavus]|uniref:Twitching motility protein PilT n=1 Tax=Flaviaesturariibacter flavus TaxID=2502780 RepID=A0A4R1BAX0_9BACT|nr:Mut7-C RNAse domain-containing protein [Flaviaesturariibacter flavus]TCJ14109.1 hypothetical protein EPD60_08850 [Flaviaesturariibacter flavus]